MLFGESPKTQGEFQLVLPFSYSFLLRITIFHLLPEVYSTQNKNIELYIIGGLLLQLLLEFISQGVEHRYILRQKLFLYNFN